MSDVDYLVALASEKILDYSGIYLAQAQIPSLINYLEKQAASRMITAVEFCKSLTPHTPDFDALINLITVNETYFFREEKQFDYLKDELFPKYRGRNLTIWSCCCATGEEAISLLSLALSMNINATIYASDIDDQALSIFKKGVYSTYSLRDDGGKYHSLLDPYSIRKDKEIIFRQDFLSLIHTFKFNLIQGNFSNLPFFEKVDVIFMRNVFIYFDKETRTAVTKKISERLNDNGKLFFSMNEVGSIDNTVIPKELCKTNSGIVYFFEKSHNARALHEKDTPIGRRLHEKQKEKANQKVQKEVQKVKVKKYSEEKKAAREEAAEKMAVKSSALSSFDAKNIYENVCKEIHCGDFTKARAIARDISGADTKKYSFFMQGYVEYHADNRAAAETLFASAESISPDFWPAFFYHGMVLRDLGKMKHASICFIKCKELISGFGSKVPYDFALDSFSPSYINSLCERFSSGGGQ